MPENLSMKEQFLRCFIYCIALENGKYYVGTTDDPSSRIYNHAIGTGAKWTRIHPITDVVFIKQITEFERADLERETTRALMHEFGVDNVRGGPYCKVIMHEKTRKDLQESIARDYGE